MIDVIIKDDQLKQAAEKGMDAFLKVVVDSIYKSIGGELTSDNMSQLSADQTTLLAYHILREEVMDGGFVQLIYNGYGAFIFKNPFGIVLRNWGLKDLYNLINKAHKLYTKYHHQIEKECSDEEFMALFEQFDEFDSCDDNFVENEERWTAEIAYYIDQHIDNFAQIAK